MKYPQTFKIQLDAETADRLCMAVLRDWMKLCASDMKSKHPDDRATDKKVYEACKTLLEFWS